MEAEDLESDDEDELSSNGNNGGDSGNNNSGGTCDTNGIDIVYSNNNVVNNVSSGVVVETNPNNLAPLIHPGASNSQTSTKTNNTQNGVFVDKLNPLNPNSTTNNNHQVQTI